jgi:hypothetical protein
MQGNRPTTPHSIAFRRIAWLIVIFIAGWVSPASAGTLSQGPFRLPGHVPAVLKRAKPVAATRAAKQAPLTLTVLLSRSDQAGFDRYLHDVYDPGSPQFHHMLSQQELAARFGPNQESYDAVLAWLHAQGFALEQSSANRLTVTVKGTRRQAEQAFALRIRDYKIGKRRFYANDNNPALPAELVGRVTAISGLSNLAVVKAPVKTTTPADVRNRCSGDVLGLIPIYGFWVAFSHHTIGWNQSHPVDEEGQDLVSVLSFMSVVFNNLFAEAALPYAVGDCVGFYLGYVNHSSDYFLLRSRLPRGGAAQFAAKPRKPWQSADSKVRAESATPAAPVSPSSVNKQKIGLLEFDTFNPSDVQNWLALVNADPGYASRLSTVAVSGGVTTPGAGEAEVLLDIAAVMLADPSQNTSYVVYSAPNGTSYQQMFNAMINDGDTVISNSWSQCEDQTSLADAQAIDSVLAQAAASGISVFNGSGDNGGTCLDGSANTIGVPTDSPHATSVGGTTPTFGPGLTYAGESWWNGSTQVPPTGAGGYGVSKYFSRPSYQNGLTTATMRSVPDLAVVADPWSGMSICQSDAGGCPNGLLYGGTSMAAPLMAGMVAMLNEVVGSNLGQANAALYPLAGTSAFNSIADGFSYVGLGSPNYFSLLETLSHYQVGPVDPTASAAGGTIFPVADGTTQAVVRVNLADTNKFPVPGKTVSLTPNAGSQAVVSAPSGPSDATAGAVTFAVTDTAAETVTFTATDTTDGITLVTQPSLTFLAPPATAGSINVSLSAVPADGSSTTTITVTLQNAQGIGAAGKLVSLSQGSGHSVITAPNPPVTDATGQIQFTATDDVSETVTYTAVDVDDYNLPVPGSEAVTFSGSGTSCVGAPPTAASGYTLIPFATGFAAQNFYYSGVNYNGCGGAENPSFDSAGWVYVSDFYSGNLYKFSPAGGTVTSGNTLASLGQTLSQTVFGTDGSLYVPHSATGGGYTTGNVVQIDPTTGAVVKIVASNLTCPGPLGVDPLSGDLFFTDDCYGGGADNPALFRISNPGSASPTVSVYATLPYTPNGAVAFAPNGTIYVESGYTGKQSVVQVSGTNQPSPPVVTTLSGINSTYWITMGAVQADGAAKSLLVPSTSALQVVDITATPYTTTTLANGVLSSGTIGPDGCLYLSSNNAIFKLAPSSGGCGFAPSNPAPALSLAPATVSPSPVQGTPTTFTATLLNVSQPQGTPITFVAGGANSVVQLVQADSNGHATFTYGGIFPGTDQVTASAAVGSQTAISNIAQVTWTGGAHTTFLTLNPGPTGGSVGQPATLQASLTDVSVNPMAPVADISVTFTLDGQTCSGTTDSNGLVSCKVTPNAGGLTALSASSQSTSSYLGASASASFLTAAMSDFSLSATSASQTVSAGQTATYSLSVSPASGAFTSAVSLACSGLPALSTCTFSPSSVTPGGSAAAATMTISTTAPTVSFRQPPLRRSAAPLFALWFVAPGMLLSGAALGRRRRNMAGILLATLLVLLLSLCVSCGSHSGGGGRVAPQGGTPAGTYTVTVTGTSGSLQHTTTVTLVVQ